MTGRPGSRVRPAGTPTVIAAVMVGVLYLVGATVVEGFGSSYGLSAMLTLAAFAGVAAAGQTLAILLRGVDLSVPYLIGLGNVVVAGLTDRGWPFGLSLLAVVVVAAAVGACNGLLSWALEVPSVIVTLATGTIVQGGYQV